MNPNTSKDALLKLNLKADSGYQSVEEIRISPNQWFAIMKSIKEIVKD